MKIYCIKFDGLPFRSEVFRMRDLVNGKLVRQIGGCFTIETMAQMLVGKNSSQLKPHGIGYTSWMDECKDITKAVGPIQNRDIDGIPDWSWLKDTVPFVLKLKLEAVNPPTLCGCFGYIRHKEMYSRVILPNNIGAHHEYIKKIQASSDDKMYVINYGQAHDACELSVDKNDLERRQHVATDYLLSVLKLWNFNEPDALFWIFSDHGHWRLPELGGYPYDHNFITWAIVKDNRVENVPLMQNFISAKDFYSYTVDGQWPVRDFYFTEDGRMNINSKRSTTAIVCKVSGDSVKVAIYHEPDNKFIQRNYRCFDYELSFVSETEVEEDLVEKLKSNFEWVK